MFDFVRKHMRLMQFVLVLLIFPSFVFFGIQGYSRFTDGGNAEVATVDGYGITRAEWDLAHRNQVERARQQMPNIDARFFDSPEVHRETLDALVRERVILAAATRLNLVTTDDRLQRLFVSDPQYAALRNPDGSVNRDFLAAQGSSSEQFARQLRQELTLRQVLAGVGGSALGSAQAAEGAFGALLQQREVQVLRFNTKDYLGKAQPTDEQIETFYKDPAHQAEFTAPESAAIEYAVLDLDAIKKDVTVSDDELRKYYDENAARYTTPEERRASHILVKADKSAPADERAKAKTKAESLLAQLRKSPQLFAELAKKNSDDPGSAVRGGDLDYFGRGAMVKPFEDSVFALKPGEVSDLVETDFGYHIIRVDAIRGGVKKPFDEVRAEITEEIKKQLAQRKYAEAAEQFSNLVYEQADSLKPVADRLKLEVRKAQVQRQPQPGAEGPLANAKFLEVLFGADTLRNKRNTEATETAPNQLVSGRVVQYTPAQLRPLAEVKASVRERLMTQQAAAQARKEGEAKLAILKAGASETLPTPAVISRARTDNLPQAVVDAALRADSTQLPGWIGVSTGDEGYAVVKINKVLPRDPAIADTQRVQTQYAQAWAGAESRAYYEALKKRYKAEIKPIATTLPVEAAATR